MSKFKDEIGATVGNGAGSTMAATGMGVASTEMRAQALAHKKKRLYGMVANEANLPPRRKEYARVVPSVAYRGLQRDYNVMCKGFTGGLLIVYDQEGKGKSFAMQGVARFKSDLQPHRFLVINQKGSASCQQLYQNIKDRVLGTVHFDFPPTEVAEVIQYGLCGPTAGDESYMGIEKLPPTDNMCRLAASGNTTIRPSEKTTNFPILVIDEFNPSDFAWEKDYSLHELEQKMGDAFKFFNALTGQAHSDDGFVVFLGTKSEAFARAIHKINGGTKAALARSTTNDPAVDRPFSDWRGIQWSAEDKAEVVCVLFEEKMKRFLRKQRLTEVEVETRATDLIREICAHDHWHIRRCCEEMQKKLEEVDEETAVIVRMGTKDGSPERDAWWKRFCCGSME